MKRREFITKSSMALAAVAVMGAVQRAGSRQFERSDVILPVVTVERSQIGQLPVCITNPTNDVITIAVDESGLRNVEVLVSRGERTLTQVEASRTSPDTAPRIQIQSGGHQAANINLGDLFGREQLVPGTYRVVMTLTPLGDTLEHQEGLRHRTAFVLVIQ